MLCACCSHFCLFVFFKKYNKGRYEFDAIVEYLRIPKRSYWNDDLFEVWAENQPDVYKHDHLCHYNTSLKPFTRFTDTDDWSYDQDKKFFESYLLHLFSNPQEWQNTLNGNGNTDPRVTRSNFAAKWISKNKDNSIVDAFKTDFIDEARLKELEAEGNLYSGNVATVKQSMDYIREEFGNYRLNEIRDKKIIEFANGVNKRDCTIFDDKITFYVNVKNIESLNVKIFEINTKSYYRQNKSELKSDLNLDGFNASHEWVLDDKTLNLKNTFTIRQLEIDLPKQLLHKRGVYFVDLLGSGLHARGIIRIGNIQHVVRVTEAGHEFTLYDEKNSIIKNSNIWMSGHSYDSDENGSILIPFTNSKSGSKEETILLSNHDDPNFNVLDTFHHDTERYDFSCGFYVDREQLLEKQQATIFFKSNVTLNNQAVSLKLCKKVLVSVKISTLSGIDTVRTFGNVKLYDNEESSVTLTMPMEPTAVAVSINCVIESMTDAKELKFSRSQSFDLNSINKSSNIAQLHAIPMPNNQYIICLNGKNGEPLPYTNLTFRCSHEYLTNELSFTRSTDKHGRIYIPCMNDYTGFRVSASNYRHVKLSVPLNDRFKFCNTPSTVHLTEDSKIRIPYYCNNTTNTDSFYYGLFDKTYSQRFEAPYIEYNKQIGFFTISKLPEGEYELKMSDPGAKNSTIVHIVSVKARPQQQQQAPATADSVETKENKEASKIVTDDSNGIVTDDSYIQLSETDHLNIINIGGNRRQGIKIKLYGVTPNTRCHVIGTHYLPTYDILNTLSGVSGGKNGALENFLLTLSKGTCAYLEQRILGDEYKYVLERQNGKKFVGNSLERPSLLAKPLEHQSTKTTEQKAKTGTNLKSNALFDKPKKPGARSKQYGIAVGGAGGRATNYYGSPTSDRKTLDFLAETSMVLLNLKCGNNKRNANEIIVDPKLIGSNHQFFQVIVIDGDEFVLKTFVLEPNSFGNQMTNCPGKHGLTKFKTDHKGFLCDICNNSQVLGSTMYGCRTCNFDICTSCYLNPSNDTTVVTGNDGNAGTDIKGVSFNYRDNRLFPGLDVNKTFLDRRDIFLLNNKGDAMTVEDFKTSEVETYDTLDDVFKLLVSLAETIDYNHNLTNELKNDWSFLTQWNQLSQDSQLSKYNQFMCHELNFFLFKKDVTFFEQVCVPLIEAKLHKSFLDYYMLGEYKILIDKYIGANQNKLAQYNRLNIFEKVLLASIVMKQKSSDSSNNDDDDDSKSPQIPNKKYLDFLEQKLQSIKMDPSRFDQLFKAALATKSMNSDKKGGAEKFTNKKKNNINSIEHQQMLQMSEELEKEMAFMAVNEKQMQLECAEIDDDLFGMDDGDLFDMESGAAVGDGWDDDDGGADWGADEDADEDDDDDGFAALEITSDSLVASAIDTSVLRSKTSKKDRVSDRVKVMQNKQLFKQLESTKEYQETYYYKKLFETNTSTMIPESAFWCDFGKYMLGGDDDSKNGAFISSNILVANHNINEVLLVLAVLDCPFQSDGPAYSYDANAKAKAADSNAVTLTVDTPTVVFAKQLKELKSNNDDAEEKDVVMVNGKQNDSDNKQEEEERATNEAVAIHVHYFDPQDKYTTDENGETAEKLITKEFAPGKVYSCQVVLTNFSSVEQRIELLSQIPTGSIPVNSGFRTKTTFHRLSSFQTTTFTFSFYFPGIGEFTHYPFTISKKGNEILGKASILFDSDKLIVQYPKKDVNRKINVENWKDVAVNGSLAQVKEYLHTHNICEIDWNMIYFRLKDACFFEMLYDLLNSKQMYNDTIWNYAIYHLKMIYLFKFGAESNNNSRTSRAIKLVGKLASKITGDDDVSIFDDDHDVNNSGGFFGRGQDNSKLESHKNDVKIYMKDVRRELDGFTRLLLGAVSQRMVTGTRGLQTQRLSPIFVSDQSDTVGKEKQKKSKGKIKRSKSKESGKVTIGIKWLCYDDIDVGKYHHLEYMPYVNARAHLLGKKREILNDGFKVQYERYLNRIINNSINIFSISESDLLSGIYYLLLQDRIEESIDLYNIFTSRRKQNDDGNDESKNSENGSENKIKSTFILDYLDVYMELYRQENKEKLKEKVNQVVKKYKSATLPKEKSKLLQDIELLLQDLDNIKVFGGDDDNDGASNKSKDFSAMIFDETGTDRNRQMAKLADQSSSLDFEIRESKRQIVINYANIKSYINVNFFTMNTEVLFSERPFLGLGGDSKDSNDENEMFSYISPNMQIVVNSAQLENKENDSIINSRTIDIPPELRNENVFIQVVSESLSANKPFYDNQLNVQIHENYGQLKVFCRKENETRVKPLKKAYVKVYALTNGGKNEFYKDGYTDVRGKFDYASISTDQLNRTKKFAIFVKSDLFGCVVKQANPPKQ